MVVATWSGASRSVLVVAPGHQVGVQPGRVLGVPDTTGSTKPASAGAVAVECLRDAVASAVQSDRSARPSAPRCSAMPLVNSVPSAAERLLRNWASSCCQRRLRVGAQRAAVALAVGGERGERGLRATPPGPSRRRSRSASGRVSRPARTGRRASGTGWRRRSAPGNPRRARSRQVVDAQLLADQFQVGDGLRWCSARPCACPAPGCTAGWRPARRRAAGQVGVARVVA